MIKRIYISILFLILSSVVFGQFVGKDNFSISMYYLQKQEIDSAKKYIDLAVADSVETKQIKTVYYKGYIYKELYKLKDKNKRVSAYRTTSINSFVRVIEIDKKEEFTVSSKKVLKYLSATLYNDIARSLNSGTYESATMKYNRYREIMMLVDSTVDLSVQDVKFKMALASMLGRKISAAGKVDTLKKEMIKDLYLEVLEVDSNNATASYNLAILYYNEGADLINAMDYDMDLEEMNNVQDKCVDLFMKGLPYMKKAYELNYKKKQTLIGLSNIYYGLNDVEKSDYYKGELRAFEDQGGSNIDGNK